MSITGFFYRAVLIVLIIAVALAIWTLREALLLTFFGVIIATGLSAPVDYLTSRGFNHELSVLATLTVAFLVVAIFVVIVVPDFMIQARELNENLPDSIEQSVAEYNNLAAESSFLPEITRTPEINTDDVIDFVSTSIGNRARSVFPFLTTVGAILTNIFVVIVITIYLLANPRPYISGMLTLIPSDKRERATEIINKVGRNVQLALGAQLFSMVIVAIATSAGLAALDVENALGLGMLAGVLDFVPTFGPLFAYFVAAIFTLATEPEKIIWVTLLFLVIQQVESNFLTPRVVRRALDMPEAAVIVTQIVAGSLFGVLGFILAVPLLATVMTLVQEIYVHDTLHTKKVDIEIDRSTPQSKIEFEGEETWEDDDDTPQEIWGV